MQRSRYQTGHDPAAIARDAVTAEPRALTNAEAAVDEAILAATDMADMSDSLADGILARTAFAAAAPHIAAIVLRDAALALPAHLSEAGGHLRDYANAFDPAGHATGRDAARYRLDSA